MAYSEPHTLGVIMKIRKILNSIITKKSEVDIAKILDERPAGEFFYITPDGKKLCLKMPDNKIMVMIGRDFGEMTPEEINEYFQIQIRKMM
jgi:hypothetical protein